MVKLQNWIWRIKSYGFLKCGKFYEKNLDGNFRDYYGGGDYGYRQQLLYSTYIFGDNSYAVMHWVINQNSIDISLKKVRCNGYYADNIVPTHSITEKLASLSGLTLLGDLTVNTTYYTIIPYILDYNDTNPPAGEPSEKIVCVLCGYFSNRPDPIAPYSEIRFIHRMWFDRKVFINGVNGDHDVNLSYIKTDFQIINRVPNPPYTFLRWPVFENPILVDKDWVYTSEYKAQTTTIYAVNCINGTLAEYELPFGLFAGQEFFPIYAPDCVSMRCLWVSIRTGKIYQIYYDGNNWVHSDALTKGGYSIPSPTNPNFHLFALINSKNNTGLNNNYLITTYTKTNPIEGWDEKGLINDVSEVFPYSDSIVSYKFYKRFAQKNGVITYNLNGYVYPHNIDKCQFPYFVSYDMSSQNFKLVLINLYSFAVDEVELPSKIKNMFNFNISQLEYFFGFVGGCVIKRKNLSYQTHLHFGFSQINIITENGISQKIFKKSFTLQTKPSKWKDGEDFTNIFTNNRVYTLYSDQNEFIGDFILNKKTYDSRNWQYEFIDANSDSRIANTVNTEFVSNTIAFSKYINLIFLLSKRFIPKISNCNENITINHTITNSIFGINDLMFSMFDCGMKLGNGYIEFDGNGIISPYCMGYNKQVGSSAPYGKWVEWGIENATQESINNSLWKIIGVCEAGIYERVFFEQASSGYSMKCYYPNLSYEEMKKQVDSINFIDNSQNTLSLVVNKAIFDEYDLVYVDFTGVPESVMPFMKDFVGFCVVVDSVYYPENEISRITIQNLYYVRNLETPAYYNDQLIEGLVDRTSPLVEASNVMFKYGKASEQSVAISTSVSIYFTHRIYDLGNNMVYADGNYWYFKPPVNGIYHFEVVLTTIVQTFTAGKYLHLFLTDGSGNMIARLDYHPIEANTQGTQIFLQGSTDIYLQANTQVYVKVWHTNTSAVIIESDAELTRNCFTMRLIKKM